MKRLIVCSLSAALAASAGLMALPAAGPVPGACAGLAALQLADTSIKSAEEMLGSSFAPPDGSAALRNLPPFCRVVAVTRPAVTFEVWLPLGSWNGKFEGVGNGGTAGVISYAAMATALRRGYATASTDTGHVSKNSADSTWALGRPDLVADFGYRGLHVTTENAKKITQTFYDARPTRSYYVGCSKGGQQGLMEAQRFPEDYDGLIAGDPANNTTRSYAAGHLWAALATLKDPESYIPASKLPLLTSAVTAACDALDGIVDGVLDDPRVCKFDPAALACKAGQDPGACFTDKQVKAVKDLWAGPRNSSGELIYPGYMPGGEAGRGSWDNYVTGTGPLTGRHFQLADGFFKNVVFGNPNWDFRTFSYDTDFPVALAKVGRLLDAVDPDLRPLQQRGAKLIVYHGWADASIPPLNSVNYFESVVSLVGGSQGRDAALEKTKEFFRLFMVPGMQHCAGGAGPDTFDMLTSLENWVEKGVAPERVVASHLTGGKVDRTRPLCPYPQVAVYTGSGSTDEAVNFVCRAPRSTTD